MFKPKLQVHKSCSLNVCEIEIILSFYSYKLPNVYPPIYLYAVVITCIAGSLEAVKNVRLPPMAFHVNKRDDALSKFNVTFIT